MTTREIKSPNGDVIMTITFMTREETMARESPEQKQQRERKEREKRELQTGISALTCHQTEVWGKLWELVDELGDCGVDVSYFPHSAQMKMLEWAKKF
jgi:hypothetical protein